MMKLWKTECDVSDSNLKAMVTMLVGVFGLSAIGLLVLLFVIAPAVPIVILAGVGFVFGLGWAFRNLEVEIVVRRVKR